MLDINGQELQECDLVQILCELVAIDDDGIRVRILNSEQELLVSTHVDEVLGGHVASSELTKFEGAAPPAVIVGNGDEDDGDEVKRCPME